MSWNRTVTRKSLTTSRIGNDQGIEEEDEQGIVPGIEEGVKKLDCSVRSGVVAVHSLSSLLSSTSPIPIHSLPACLLESALEGSEW